MAKKARVRHLCTFCEMRLRDGEAFCEACGTPTMWASHEQKVAWELQRYEKDRGKLIEEIPSTPLPVIPRVYVRRASADVDTRAPSRRTTESRARRTPRETLGRPVQMPVRRHPVEVEVPSVEDQALLFKIVRILNQRIADLEDRIEQLEAARSEAIGS